MHLTENIFSSIEKAFLKLRRKRVSQYIFNLNDGIVQKGLFEGLKLTDNSNISKGPLALKIYGFYEEVLINEIMEGGDLKSY